MTKAEKAAAALRAAYEVCFIMKDQCENVLAGCDPNDETSRDQELLSQADTFLNWYNSNIKK